jgi:hypothetical protein
VWQYTPREDDARQTYNEGSMRDDSSTQLIWFLAGLGMGTAAGILLAPKAGSETRRMIGSRASEAGHYLSAHGHDYYERGRELYEKGRHLADEAAQLFDEGRRLVEEARAEAGNG